MGGDTTYQAPTVYTTSDVRDRSRLLRRRSIGLALPIRASSRASILARVLLPWRHESVDSESVADDTSLHAWMPPDKRRMLSTSDRAAMSSLSEGMSALQSTAGNRAISRLLTGRSVAAVQRCGPHPCSCSPDERAAKEAEMLESEEVTADTTPIQRQPTAPGPTAATAQNRTETQAARVLTEEGQPTQPGTIARSEFMATLRQSLTTMCDAELAAVGRSSEGCPYLTHWLGYYERQPAERLERTIALWTGTRATTAEQLQEAVISRVRGAIRVYVATGEVTGVPEAPPDVGDAPTAAPGGAAPTAAPTGPVQRSESASSPGNVRAGLGPGSALDAKTRAVWEPALGRSFADVRVHSDSSAGSRANGLGYAAFTVGQHIVMPPDQHHPDTIEGSALLGHELAHTVQQSGEQSVSKGDQEQRDGTALESEADAAVMAAASGRSAAVQSGRGLRIQGCGNKVKACPTGKRWYPVSTLQWGSFGCTCLWKCVDAPPSASGGYSGPTIRCPPNVNCSDPYDRVSEDYRKTGYGAAFTPLTGAPACGCFPLDIEGREQTEAPLVEVTVDMTTIVGPGADMAAGARARRRGGGGGGTPRTDPTTGTRIPDREPQLANPLRSRAIREGLYTPSLAPRLDAAFRESDPAVMQAINRTFEVPAAERSARVTRLLDWMDRRPSAPRTIQEGAVFGRGGTGSVAEVVGRPDLASKTGAGRAGSEAAAMVELELAGIPTVYVAEGRTATGATRLVLRRIDGVGSKDIIGRPGRPPEDLAAARQSETLVTDRTISDLQNIRARLEAAQLNIGDFQFILQRSDGAVFVNDPTGVTPNSRPSGDIANIIDRFTAIRRRQREGTPR